MVESAPRSEPLRTGETTRCPNTAECLGYGDVGNGRRRQLQQREKVSKTGVTEAVCSPGDVSGFLARGSLGEHPPDDRRFSRVRDQLFCTAVGIVPKRNPADKSQVALLQPFPSIGDAGGDHLALKLSEGSQDVQHETVLRWVAELRRCHHYQGDIHPAELVKEFHTVAQ